MKLARLAPVVVFGLHASCSGARSGEPAEPQRASSVHVPPDLDELLDAIAAHCAGPEGVEACAPNQFEETFAEKLPRFVAHREALVRHWLAALERGNHTAAYGLAWARHRAGLPALRKSLLSDRYFYGWESDDANTLEARMRDDQYPHHLAFISAIEHISGKPLAEAVALQPTERAALLAEARQPGDEGGPQDVARWLLHKLAPDALEAGE